MSVQAPSNPAISDLAQLAELARDGSLDLTSVAFRVRTDLMVGLSNPTPSDLSSYVEFAAAALGKLTERDLNVVCQKLAGWAHTPPEIEAALTLRLPKAADMFAARRADPLARQIRDAVQSELQPAATSMATGLAPVHAATPSPSPQPVPAAGQKAIAGEALNGDLSSGDIDRGQADAGEMPEASLAARVAAAREALLAGDRTPACAILDDPSAGPAAHAAFFLIATPVQQSLMLGGLKHLTRQEPRRRTGERQRIALARILDLAAADRTGAFLALADSVGGSPEFAARITLDGSRKLAGLCILAIGGNDEDAVRFALRLADAPSESVQVIFALADMARAIDATIAWRMVRAIGGSHITPETARPATHIPAADPSSAANRQPGLGQAQRRATPQEAARRLLG